MPNGGEHTPLPRRPYARRWLEDDLPELVRRGVISDDIALRIRAGYVPTDGGAARRWGAALLAVLAAVLIGGGLMLLLAHNWDGLSRPARAAIAIAPLVISAGLGAQTLAAGRGAAWREGVGAFQSLAVGLALALIGQTYHLGSTVDDLMRAWALLVLPLVYSLDAAVPVLVYLGTLLGWAGALESNDPQRLAALGGLLLLVPYLAGELRRRRAHPRTLLLMWASAIALPVAYLIAIRPFDEAAREWRLWVPALLVAMHLIGARLWPAEAGVRAAPWRVVGAVGAVVVTLLMSFRATWVEVEPCRGFEHGVGVFLLAAPLSIALALAWDAVRRREWGGAWTGPLVIGVAGARVLAGAGGGLVPALILTAVLVLIGVLRLVQGLRGRRLGAVNAGMALLGAVMLARFFDTELSYLWRGVAFIVAGAVMLGVNLAWGRRAARGEPQR
ncbi:MAG: DUF2157 domain-containing protein [Kiritimatiellae bacterium]|nr:DUF2157 domain-containing protein [Kiritimatiellia bacterium]